METIVAPKIEQYCREKSTLPCEICREIADYTKNNVAMSQMLVGPLEASFLAFIIRSINARRVLEIGTYTGYSALAMAAALPDGGELITLDVSNETTAIAQNFWDKSPHGKKIKSIVAPALETIESLVAPFDLVFIDADKRNYSNYLNRSLELLSPSGVILIDNCLWSGDVADTAVQDERTNAIREVANIAANNESLHTTMIPLRDGILMVQRKS